MNEWTEIKPSVVAWVAILIVMAAWELWAVLDGKEHTLPLTTVTITWVPGVVTMAFLGWLFGHFLIRYIQSGHWWFK